LLEYFSTYTYGDAYKYQSNLTQIFPFMVSIINCNFHNNDCGNICQINNCNYFASCSDKNLPLISLVNVSFLDNRASAVIHARYTIVSIEEVVISEAFIYLSIISALKGGRVFIHRYFEISGSFALTAFTAHKIVLTCYIIHKHSTIQHAAYTNRPSTSPSSIT